MLTPKRAKAREMWQKLIQYGRKKAKKRLDKLKDKKRDLMIASRNIAMATGVLCLFFLI